jgi:uncharacterized membrane protein YqhA
MLRFVLSLRFVMLLASLGAAVGALLLFWEGSAKLVGAASAVVTSDDSKPVVVSVLGAIDTYLLGIVLVVFAYAIAFGFVLDLPPDVRQSLPPWMRVQGVSELKHGLIEVVLVYLVVDFTTDWAESDIPMPWQTLVKPASIFLIAGALRLLGTGHSDTPQGS